MNDEDARRLGIAEGDVIRIWNARGATLAAARPSREVAPSVVQLSTGAWYAARALDGIGTACVNGNPNAVTADRPASAFSQGCAGQITLVSVERFRGDPPPAVPHQEILPREPS